MSEVLTAFPQLTRWKLTKAVNEDRIKRYGRPDRQPYYAWSDLVAEYGNPFEGYSEEELDEVLHRTERAERNQEPEAGQRVPL